MIRQQQQQRYDNNIDNSGNMDPSKNNNHVVDLGGVKVRPLDRPVVTFKLVGLVVGVVLGLVLLVQLLMMYSLDTADETRRNQRDRDSAQHIHPEVIDLAMSKISRLALGNIGRKHMEVLQKVATEARRFRQDLEPCDSECKRFRELINKWPVEKPKGAIVILTQVSRVHQLKALLEALDKYFLDKFKYPIVLYHEENYLSYFEQVQGFSKTDIFFQQVTFKIPEFVNMSRVPEMACLKGIGYRHMCRFQSKMIFNQPIIAELEYMFRLDDDSMVTSPIHYDLFRFMKDKDKHYGYMWELEDAFDCTEGLWEATENYIRENALEPTFFNQEQWPEPRIFYNNFEISKMEIWNKMNYRDFVDYIDKLGGIYYHRWGDAPIKGLALSLFVPRDKLHRFIDLGYRHAGMNNDPAIRDKIAS